MKDFEISISDWNRYLRKYEPLYRLQKADDGIWQIRCSGKNFITIFSIADKLLLFYLTGYASNRGRNVVIEKLRQKRLWFKIHQDGDSEVTILFKESDLPDFADVFKVRKRRRYSPEYRKVLQERAKLLSQSSEKGEGL